MNKKLHEQLVEATTRIEALIHLGGMVTGDALPDQIDDLLQEEDDDTLEQCFPGMPGWVREALEDRHERGDAFGEWVFQTGRLGFVVQFATPVMSPVGDGARTYSWGHYFTVWVYGETLEEAVQKGLEWAAMCRAGELGEADPNAC